MLIELLDSFPEKQTKILQHPKNQPVIQYKVDSRFFYSIRKSLRSAHI